MDKIFLRRLLNQLSINTVIHKIATGKDLMINDVSCEGVKAERILGIYRGTRGYTECRWPKIGRLPCCGCRNWNLVSEEPETFINWE